MPDIYAVYEEHIGLDDEETMVSLWSTFAKAKAEADYLNSIPRHSIMSSFGRIHGYSNYVVRIASLDIPNRDFIDTERYYDEV